MEITSGIVQVPTADGTMSAFIAQPTGGGKHPAIIVVQEAFGLNAHIKDVAVRLAREGYVSLAPDLYYRENNAVVGYDNLPEAIRLMMTLADDKIAKDMGAAISYLQQQPGVRADRIGVTGFCMGGRVTFLTACLNPAVKAAAPFYGGGIGSVMQPSERTPKAPLEYADKLAAPLLLFFGENDSFIPLDEVERIKTRLAELKKTAETVVYPGAPHGFFCEERDSYRADAAKDAWTRLLTFFNQHLQG
ncbi:MAG TPA: dienelactone hydrolase family protein [Candidatus Margulisiibacteriota bacterium]|nr:dienelactone hydrolase family protein [Candidatus Margulisiibacteriota bacterium]